MSNPQFFHEGDHPYHIETITLIFSASQWTGFYMIGTSVMKELNPQNTFCLKRRVAR